jgi:hypothetical protein
MTERVQLGKRGRLEIWSMVKRVMKELENIKDNFSIKK